MWHKPERIWRAFGTGLFLAVIGLGGSLLALTVFPAIALVTRDRDRRQKRIQAVLHRSLRLYCRAIHAFKVADVEMKDTERLKSLTGVMLIANHPSLLDVVMIMAAIPNVQCIVKGGLWRNPFFRLTVEGAGYIRNDQDPETLLRTCIDTLKAGNNLIVFPEGTRTVPGRPIVLRRGFANIAILGEADLQLIRIECTPPILHKGNPWWKVPATRTRFKMEVGDRLDIHNFLGYRYRSLSARKLVEFIEEYYTESHSHGCIGTGAEAADRFVSQPRGCVS
ncbi:lysophospholipid acyltransferase family protein [Magnetospirillum fulvum]|uniref:1-acyl-sn-glycerol-3-phosphate acyltransferases n=1 Tax=Magnetospirillum fulvum TaxID=1082 RepID=A0A1H6ITU4_MAGFU|nr:lysophospholipid acyltransferase family protein [Magnetospirillum fulvum]SEH49897.1 1-acyl-sn-glycerol-3-phosphate acyltransferases [Magnetospirillum fulvum]